MKKRVAQILTVCVLMYVMALTSEASLVVRGTDELGNKLIYDEALDITWYDYSKSGDDWGSQVSWAGGLSVTYNQTIYDDWRLPTAGTTPRLGYNQSGADNEMEHLWFDEGSGGIPTEFSNIPISSPYYWAGTEYAPNPADSWIFQFMYGGESTLSVKYIAWSALAVRSGDVSGSSVPELPCGAMQLMVMMGGVLYVRIRKAGNIR